MGVSVRNYFDPGCRYRDRPWTNVKDRDRQGLQVNGTGRILPGIAVPAHKRASNEGEI
jgi:hypothetical protein